jgi:hypothetical protein
MVCNLRQIRVSKKLSPEEAEKDIKAATLELDTDVSQLLLCPLLGVRIFNA